MKILPRSDSGSMQSPAVRRHLSVTGENIDLHGRCRGAAPLLRTGVRLAATNLLVSLSEKERAQLLAIVAKLVAWPDIPLEPGGRQGWHRR